MNGDGTFEAGEYFPAGSGCRTITLADFNGDGLIDIAVPNEGSEYTSILFNATSCQLLPGDANSDDIFNSLDIEYGINYLKRIGPPTTDICHCGTWGFIYSSADANGDCRFNGIDIVYEVNYLKGLGSAPRRCGDCPE